MIQDGRNITGGTRAHQEGLWAKFWKSLTPQERRATNSSATPGWMVNGKWVTKNDH